MALETLFQQVEVTDLPPGQEVVIPHDLHRNTTRLRPDVIIPDQATAIGVVVDADATDTDVKFTNTGELTTSAKFLLWSTHTIIGTDVP